jgi:hypothetical protein
MAQRVGCDGFGGQRGARGRGGGDVALDEPADGVAAELFASRAWEQRVAWRVGPFAEPGFEYCSRFSPQRG